MSALQRTSPVDIVDDLPPCVSCPFGQAHRRLWRHKSSTTSTDGVLQNADITKPGQQVGTDQIVSAQPQEKGQMTRASIGRATVFVDYASSWVKVHLMQDATGDSTLEANNAFERDCMTRNVVPKHYHANNGRFAENSFKEDCVGYL